MSDGGTIRTQYVIDFAQAQQAAQQIRAQLQGIQQSTAQIAKANVGVKYGPTQQNAAQVSAYAQAQARLAQISNTGKNALVGLTQAEQIYQNALTKVNANSIEAIRLQTQLQTVQNRIANVSGGGLLTLPRSLENFGPQALQQIQSGLLGIVGPAAAVAAGFGAIKGAINLTEESFKLKAALDTTNLSIQLQLKNFRDVNQTLQDGAQFAERYAITQEENADAIQASIPILRTTKASLSDVEGVLARLAVLKPEQGIRGAAFALGELEGGQSRSLATRFNIPLAKANELRDAVRNGGDAIQVMGQYLDSVGLGMETLDTRTQGATGRMNQLKVETEKFQLALGGQAGGPGLDLLNTRIDFTRGATRLLSGDFDEFGRSVTANIAQGQTGILSFLNVFQPFAQQVQQKIDAAAEASARLAEKTELGAGAFNAASAAAIFYASNVQAAGAAALNSASDVNILTAALGGAARESRHIGGVGQGVSGLGGLLTEGFDQTVKNAAFADAQAAKAAADAKRALNDQIALAKATGNTARARKLLNQELADAKRTGDVGEQARIISELKSLDKTRVGTAQSTALQLANVEENSGAQLLKIQRENQERLRDQEQDYQLSRTRATEDFQERYIGLLARGQRAAAAKAKADFEKDQKRDAEDRAIQLRRTLRNNAESLGDTSASADRRSSQIQARAALRGVTGGTAGGGGSSGTSGGVVSSGGVRTIQLTMPSAIYSPDGTKLGDVVYPRVYQLLDNDLALEILSAPLPGTSQTAVAGSRP